MLPWKLNAAVTFISRHQNAYWFTGCKQYTTDQLQLGCPKACHYFPGNLSCLAGKRSCALWIAPFMKRAEYLFRKQIIPKCCADNLSQPEKGCHDRNLTVWNLSNATVSIVPPLEALLAGIVGVRLNVKGFLNLVDADHGIELCCRRLVGKKMRFDKFC